MLHISITIYIYRGAGAVSVPAVVSPAVVAPAVSQVVSNPAVTTVPMMASLAPGIAIGILKALFIG